MSVITKEAIVVTDANYADISYIMTNPTVLIIR